MAAMPDVMSKDDAGVSMMIYTNKGEETQCTRYSKDVAFTNASASS